MRAAFRDHFPLRGEVLVPPRLHLGGALVSRVPCPPEMGTKVIEQLLLPHKISGRVRLLLETEPVAAETDGDHVSSVTVRHEVSGDRTVLRGAYFIDATELGDVLALSDTEYVTGAESVDQTGEPHALAVADPLDMQAITHCFAVDYLPGEDHTIPRPPNYEFWRDRKPPFWPDRLFSWNAPDPPEPSQVRRMSLFADDGTFPLWRYRRLVEAEQFLPGTVPSDITLVNWPQNDYFEGPIIEVSDEEAAANRRGAKEQSLALLYWLQTDAPREDGGCGYPGLRLRGDLMGTQDGLAKHPYIREARRIHAERTVVEQHLSPEVRPGGPITYEDSVGIGAYRIDLHPSTGGHTYVDVPTHPFQIPLGCLIPIRMENLLPAAKNIGSTHITNGCYRLHPVEWNIGEAAGTLAAHCVRHGLIPRQVRADPARLTEFQTRLTALGFELDWPKTTPL